jgi:hypothetical protein
VRMRAARLAGATVSGQMLGDVRVTSERLNKANQHGRGRARPALRIGRIVWEFDRAVLRISGSRLAHLK